MASDVAEPRMIMTVLEARVQPDQWDTLQSEYRAIATQLPPQMVRTFLVQGTADRNLWQGISIWRSREALDVYRSSVEVPEGIVVFRKAGADPTLAVFEVAAHFPRTVGVRAVVSGFGFAASAWHPIP